MLQATSAIGYAALGGINNAGQVVGNVFTTNLVESTAVIWNNGTPTLLPPPGPQYTQTYANSINDAGQVAGSALEAGGVGSVAVVWNGLTPTTLGTTADCSAGYASGINSNGLVVGTLFCNYSPGNSSPFFWRGTTAYRLQVEPTFGAPYGNAVAVNASGLIVGTTNDKVHPYEGSVSAATAWAQGVVTNLGSFPRVGGDSTATAVNSQGIVVGQSHVFGDNINHATLWSPVGSTPQDLNSLIDSESAKLYVLTEAMGINGSCTIIANGVNKRTRAQEAFLLTLTDPSRCAPGL